MSDIQELVKTYNDQRTAFVKKIKAEIKPFLLSLIKDDLIGIRWTQYTPYFNDGDACIFHVHEIYFRFKDTPEDAGDYEDGFDSTSGFSGKQKKDAKTITDAIYGIPEEIMKDVFGDHVQVTIERSGENSKKIEVEEYEHD